MAPNLTGRAVAEAHSARAMHKYMRQQRAWQHKMDQVQAIEKTIITMISAAGGKLEKKFRKTDEDREQKDQEFKSSDTAQCRPGS